MGHQGERSSTHMFTYIFSPRRFHYLHGFSSLLKGACLSVCVFWVFGSVQLGEIVCRVFLCHFLSFGYRIFSGVISSLSSEFFPLFGSQKGLQTHTQKNNSSSSIVMFSFDSVCRPVGCVSCLVKQRNFEKLCFLFSNFVSN